MKFSYLLSSSYGARISSCSNPVHEIEGSRSGHRAHCVRVWCPKRVVKLEDGPAVCFHSRQIGEVFLTWWREAAYRLSHCVTHWRRLRFFFLFFFFHKLPRINFVRQEKVGACSLILRLEYVKVILPKLLFRKWKNEMVMLIILGGASDLSFLIAMNNVYFIYFHHLNTLLLFFWIAWASVQKSAVA